MQKVVDALPQNSVHRQHGSSAGPHALPLGLACDGERRTAIGLKESAGLRERVLGWAASLLEFDANAFARDDDPGTESAESTASGALLG